MRHKISTAVFAQGWLEGQIESAVAAAKLDENENPTAAVLDQWQIVSEFLDDLIKENAELKRKLSIVESAFIR